MSSTIQQHTYSTFTVTFYHYEILTTVTASAADVDDWVNEVLRIHSSRPSHHVVGLDAEWRPSFGTTQNPVAVLQLCVGRRCLVFQILHADYIPNSLCNFVSDPRFTFIGVGIDTDANKIIEEYGCLSVCNRVDLRGMAASRMGRIELKQMGLAALALQVMGVHVEKPGRVTMSRWDNRYLTLDQVKYACVDAFLSFEIGRRLLDGEF